MHYKAGTVPLAQIDDGDETYRITTGGDLAPLAAAIESFGIINPPVLAFSLKSNHTVVCGFRRIAACRSLGWDHVSVRFIDPGASTKAKAVCAIADNSFQRDLNMIEISRAINLLFNSLPEGADIMKTAKEAGLAVAPPLLSKLRFLCRLPAKLQQGIIDTTLSLAMAERLYQRGEQEALEIYGLFCDIRAGLNVQREILDHAEESARREGVKLVDILKSKAIMAVRMSDELDRARKTGMIRHLLKKRRYPAITRAEKNFADRVGRLELPQKMRFVPPPGFEGPDYTLALKFGTIEQLRDHMHALERMLNGQILQEIIGQATD